MSARGESTGPPCVAIVGGGLAGLAAAAAAAQRGLRVELFERRALLGGRAGSFRDPRLGRLVDESQHVSMGCCTNLAAFCRRTGIDGCFRRYRAAHFIGPDGARYDFAPAAWLPAPLHLGPAMMRLGYLSLGERLAVGRAMLRLARIPPDDPDNQRILADWLRRNGRQPQGTIDRFWSVVVLGALSETVDRVSVGAARKVFADGFLAARAASAIDVPTLPLATLMDRAAEWLVQNEVVIHRRAPVERIEGDGRRATGLVLRDGTRREFDFYVVAVPWTRVRALFSDAMLAGLPGLAAVEQIRPAAITAVHLWHDRLVCPLPHAALVGRLAQWIFQKGFLGEDKDDATPEHGESSRGDDVKKPRYYSQVVISAAHTLARRDRSEILAQVLADIEAVWPEARGAKLLHWRLVYRPAAVFSCQPGLDRLRPAQRTPVENLMLAGDWTATGWPATMEGAVRGGHLAVEAILRSIGRPERLLADDLPRGWLARQLLGCP